MTTSLNGRCLNIGNCSLANAMDPIPINEGVEFVCPECGRPLETMKSRSASNQSFGIANLLAIAALAMGTVFGSYALLRNREALSSNPDRTSVEGCVGANCHQAQQDESQITTLSNAAVAQSIPNTNTSDVASDPTEKQKIFSLCRSVQTIRRPGRDEFPEYKDLKDGFALFPPSSSDSRGQRIWIENNCSEIPGMYNW